MDQLHHFSCQEPTLSGLIAQSQDKGGNVADLRMSDENEITLPMVCLVNGSTASGAELFANALHKMAGATIVGSTTAGKGVLLRRAFRTAARW